MSGCRKRKRGEQAWATWEMWTEEIQAWRGSLRLSVLSRGKPVSMWSPFFSLLRLIPSSPLLLNAFASVPGCTTMASGAPSDANILSLHSPEAQLSPLLTLAEDSTVALVTSFGRQVAHSFGRLPVALRANLYHVAVSCSKAPHAAVDEMPFRCDTTLLVVY